MIPISLTSRAAFLALAVLSASDAPLARSGRVNEDESRLPFDQPGEAQEFFARKRTPVGATGVPTERYAVARQQMRRMARYSTATRSFLPRGPQAPNLGSAWTELGPGNVGGRTRSILIHPSIPTTMWAGGVAGGVWKTTDGGASWTPTGDALANLAVSTLAMSPTDPDTILAGTGEGFYVKVAGRGAGIFKTTDGGTSWAQVADTNTPDFYFVNKLAYDPSDALRVYAATGNGVWRSTDGGVNWSSVLTYVSSPFGPRFPEGCQDLAVRTDQPTVFASCGMVYGTTPAPTVFRSTSAGDPGTWQPALSENAMGRTSLAIAPSDQNTIYAMVARGSSGFGLLGVYRSSDGGGTWQKRSNSSDISSLLLSNVGLALCSGRYSSQGFYDNVIAVDPVDPNRVWAGGIDLFRSDDGGVNWGIASYWWGQGFPDYAHADQHAIVFEPGYDGTTKTSAYFGNDGGVFKIQDARAATTTVACTKGSSGSTFTSLNNGYGVTQFYYGAVYPDDSTYFGGAQDNGTQRGSDAGGVNGWTQLYGGDGGAVAVDPTNTSVIYAESQNGNIVKSTDSGTTWRWATAGIDDRGFIFIAPFVMDPANPQRLWTGGKYMWRTTDGATSWTRASGPIGDAGQYLKISAVAVAPSNPNYLLAGTAANLETPNEGKIYRTSVGLATGMNTVWPSVQPRQGHVSSLTFHPTNHKIAYATYSTFGGTHVWKSTNAGATWTGLDGTGSLLPDLPVHSLVVDPLQTNRLYVGTDLGVFVTVDGGANWAVENSGFPNTITEHLVVNGPNLYAFTHGRGVWRVGLSSGSQTRLIEMASASRALLESDGPPVVSVRVLTSDHANTSEAIELPYATSSSSAVEGTDYTGGTGTFTIPAGTPHGSTLALPIAIVDDSFGETDETFTTTIAAPPNALLTAKTTTVVTIKNDDPASLAISDATLTEGNAGALNAVLKVVLSPAVATPVSVSYATANGTAIAPGDYAARTGTLRFPAGSTLQSLSILVAGDTLVEGPESLSVTLSNPSGATIGDGTGVVSINDNDLAGTFSFSVSSPNVNEAAAAATITVKRTGGTGSGVSVDYATSAGTASDGSDFTASTGRLSFGAGVLSKTFSVPLLADSIHEPNETVLLRLTNPQGLGAAIGTPSTAVLTIVDNDPQQIQFGAATYTVTEGTPAATIYVKRIGAATQQVTVDFVVSGTANNPSDHTLANGTVTFAPGVVQQPIVVPIVNDTTPEGPETVILALTNPAGASAPSLGTPSTTRLTINDNDVQQQLQFSPRVYSAGEATPRVVLTVKRTGGAAGSATVDVALDASTATNGDDFTFTNPTTLTFGPGVAFRTLTVPIINDGVADGMERAGFRLVNATGAAVVGPVDSAQIDITDDEPTFQFSAPGYDVKEAGKAVVTVTRTGSLAAAATVDFATSDLSATAGDDYTAASGRLEFGAGVARRSFEVFITPDTEDEINDTVQLTLSAPTPPASIGLGALRAVSITILDDDTAGTVQLGAALDSVTEDGGLAAITVTRAGGTAGPATVQYATSNGTAVAGTDYTTTSGSLTFGFNELSKTIAVPITNRPGPQANRALNLTLSNPAKGLTLGSQTTAVLWIVDTN